MRLSKKPIHLRVAVVAALLSLFAALPATAPAMAKDTPNFAGKNVTIITGSTPGGSTDVSARLVARFIGKYLAGHPNVLVENRPGARGMTAMNYFAQQVAPNGLTVIVGSGSQIDPLNYRVPNAHYDPSQFAIVGGLGIGGSILEIRNEALPRLMNKKAEPVVMATIGNIPRSGMQMAAWGIAYLGWNAKWVAGYRGNPDLILAYERGEVDMTSFATAQLTPELLDKKKYTVLYQSGSEGATVPSELPELAGVPMFAKAMEGKIANPLDRQAFDYWRNISSISNWIALPPKTPPAIVAAYRAAFAKVRQDGDFKAQAKKVGADVSSVSPESQEKTIKTLADLPPEALHEMTHILERQGLKAPKS